jgi:RNA polymerase sigma-70 factor, ECF subfamily
VIAIRIARRWVLAVACCIAQILEQYRQSIFTYLYRLVQEEEAAEEIAIEVLLLAYHGGMAYAGAPRFRLLLFRQATRLAFRRLRQCAPLPPVEETVPSRSQVSVSVPRAVAALPERERAVLLMHKYEGLNYAQIATVLACPESTAKELLWRAYHALRLQLLNARSMACATPS